MESVAALFAQFARAATWLTGRPATFAAALGLIIVWAALGPVLDFAAEWQMVFSTVTTVVTFLMVFVLQNAQTRDTAAIQAKLDQLILTSSEAENRFVGIENLNDEELEALERKVAEAASKRDRRAKAAARKAKKNGTKSG